MCGYCVWGQSLLGALDTYVIHRGVLLHNHGEGVIIHDYELINFNISIIHVNRKNRSGLPAVLKWFSRKMTNQTNRLIKSLFDGVNEKLSVMLVLRNGENDHWCP